MQIARRHWIVAIAAAVLVHAAAAAAIFWKEKPASARSAGIGGIEVSLGPAGGASGSEAAVAPPPPPPEETPPEKEEEPEPPQEIVEEQPVEDKPVEIQDVAVSEDRRPPEPLPEIVEPIPQEPEPLPEPKPEPIVEKKPVEEPPKPVETPPPPKPRKVMAPPPPKPKPQPPEPPKVVVKQEPLPEPPAKPVETKVATAPPSVSGVDGKAGTQSSKNAGNANDSMGGGIPGELVDYMSVLQAWLEKHKEYPRGARLRRIEGTTLLYFVMDRDGNVIDFRIQRSSGFSMLDSEVEAMIQRAQPLPQIPKEMDRQRLELVVPVQFMLR